MAGFFDSVIEAIAEGHAVHAALFVQNEFNAGISRNWTGLGTINLGGHNWIGTGELVKLGALAFGGDDAAPGLTMTLSGVDPAFVSEARTMPSVHGLRQTVHLQFFDADTLQPVGDFYELDRRFLDVIGFSIQGPGAASVSLSSESEWTGLNTAAYQDWSSADQQALFPGDRGLEYVGDLVYGQRIDWPDFSDSGVNEQLAEFRALAAGRSFSWGQWDCGMLCAEWVRLLRDVDPAAAWRGRYSTEAELVLILKGRGGIIAHFDRCLGGVGIERSPFPMRGDVVVVETPQGLTGGVLTGPMVIMAGVRGIIEWRIKLAAVVAAWEV